MNEIFIHITSINCVVMWFKPMAERKFMLLKCFTHKQLVNRIYAASVPY